MKQIKGLNGELKPEHKKTNIRTMMGPTRYEKTPIQIYWKFHNPKTENFSDTNSDIIHISAQNIDCGYSLEPPRRGDSNEYPESMFLSRNKKEMYTHVNPSFTK